MLDGTTRPVTSMGPRGADPRSRKSHPTAAPHEPMMEPPGFAGFARSIATQEATKDWLFLDTPPEFAGKLDMFLAEGHPFTTFSEEKTMPMSKYLRMLAIASALGIGFTVIGATSSKATVRVPCTNYNDVWAHSNQTTCWAYAGGQNVTLRYTIGVSGGINSGHVVKNYSTPVYYMAHQTKSWASTTVTYVAINYVSR